MDYDNIMEQQGATFITVIVFLITFGLYAVRSWLNYGGGPSAHTQSKDDSLQRALHTFRTSTLATRASTLASDPLENLFCLRNPFVSSSYPVQRHYREALLRQFTQTKAEDWVAIAKTAAAAVQPHLRYEEGPERGRYLFVALQDASRTVTLAAVLQGLFGINNVDPATLLYIGTEINDLFIAKKKFNATATSATDSEVPQKLRKRADQLIVTLREIFSSAKSSSSLVKAVLFTPVDGDDEVQTDTEFNPLNLVIPAFEAPWRAVFYTILAVLQQSPARCEDVLTLRDSSPTSPPSSAATAVVHEVLRLYPPIRRVRRSTPVDLERLQRDETYWGPSALEFKSSRFLDGEGHNITPSSAWLPFAGGIMKCPSANGYSARLVVTIAGEMLRQFFPAGVQPNWTLEGKGWDEAAQRGEPLKAGRNEYAGVKLRVELAQ